ncbi:MAG TPA: hypothetical protein VGL62_12945 [Vicinamibacterales bacterium]|jgi:hypothetical protein
MPQDGSKGLVDLTRLNRLRDRSLGLEPSPFLRTGNDAIRFLRRVGVALRYGAGAGVPLASMYHAAAGPDRDHAALVHAIEVTNHVLQTAMATTREVTLQGTGQSGVAVLESAR